MAGEIQKEKAGMELQKRRKVREKVKQRMVG